MRLGELRKYINDCSGMRRSSATDWLLFVGLITASLGLALLPLALAVAFLR
jgi:hypothetical protein